MYLFRTDLEAKSAPQVNVPQAPRMMCLNESCLDPFPQISNSFLRIMQKTRLNRYMADVSAELQHELARYGGVREDMLLFGNGADDMIYHIMAAVRENRDSFAVSLDPSYFDYKTFASALNLKLQQVPLDDAFSFDPEQYLHTARHPDCKLAILCNPNNPTGNLLRKEDMDYIIQHLPDKPVLVDETYFEFSGQSFVHELDKYPNLILVRSFSKAFSAAGLRFGYALAVADTIAQLRKVQTTFHTSILVQAFALAILQNSDVFADQVKQVLKLRTELSLWLKSRPGFTVHDSATNFLTFKAGERSAELFLFLQKRGIALRDVGAHPLLKGFLRVTISCADDVQAFMEAVQSFER
jgi:histidinol-phosphate aminotransferase